MTTALELRAFLHAHIDRSFPEGSVVVDEYGLGSSVADVAVFATTGLHLFEIKGDADSCRRLDGQVRCYVRLGETCTLVAGGRLFDKAVAHLPDWWGALRVVGGPATAIALKTRPALPNPNQDPIRLVRPLWQTECWRELHGGQYRFCAACHNERVAAYPAHYADWTKTPIAEAA